VSFGENSVSTNQKRLRYRQVHFLALMAFEIERKADFLDCITTTDLFCILDPPHAIGGFVVVSEGKNSKMTNASGCLA